MSDLSEHHPSFHKLLEFLGRIPTVQTNDTAWGGFGSGKAEAGWWIKFSLDIDDHLSWNVIQEMSYVLNGLSITEVLPTVLKPVSPPPYLNGGPRDFLSWVIECTDPDTKPGTIADWLEGRLPQPVDDISAWPDAE